jgi:hypothetical protein
MSRSGTRDTKAGPAQVGGAGRRRPARWWSWGFLSLGARRAASEYGWLRSIDGCTHARPLWRGTTGGTVEDTTELARTRDVRPAPPVTSDALRARTGRPTQGRSPSEVDRARRLQGALWTIAKAQRFRKRPCGPGRCLPNGARAGPIGTTAPYQGAPRPRGTFGDMTDYFAQAEGQEL